MDSSDLLSPVPEDSFTQESTVPLASSPAPMEDSLSLGLLSDFMDRTIENLVSVTSEEEELPELNSLEDLTEWLGIDCPSD
jgi:hypothetical protein